MTRIAFIGAGNMNTSIIKGLIADGFEANNIMVSNPSPEKRLSLANNYKIHQTSNNVEAAHFADYIVLGVKPHLMASVCQELAMQSSSNTCVIEGFSLNEKCFISVAAGTTIAQIQQALSAQLPVVRTMPNTPSQLGLGMTGLYSSKETSEQQKTIASQLMSAVGEIMWLNAEEKINDIIGISGSGPAYFFLFMEAMEQKALSMGFDKTTSRQLVQQTALGAASMVIENPTQSISELRENVTSKGGTTNAAIEQFQADGLPQLVTNAIDACLHRAQQLAQNSAQ